MKSLKSHYKTLLALLSVAGILAASCGLLEPDAKVTPPSFGETAAIMQRTCVACHSAAGLDGLITAVQGINSHPALLDSTPTGYSRKLITDEITTLASKIALTPELDFRDTLSFNLYVNNVAGKRDIMCQRLQFRNYRPYYPRGMPPPYTDALRSALGDTMPLYKREFADPASVIGTWKHKTAQEELVLTLLPGGELSQTHYSAGAAYRNDSVFINDTQFVAILSLSGDSLRWEDRLLGQTVLFGKMDPLQVLADFVSINNIGRTANPVKWRELGVHPLTQAYCVYCHNRDNFLGAGSRYQGGQAPLLQRVAGLPKEGLRVNVRYNPQGLSRQLKSLGHTLLLTPVADFTDVRNIEKFMALANEAQDMADRLQTPLYHDWYPGGMPPPWAASAFKAVDPGARQYGFTALSDESRKGLLAFLQARLNVAAFTFQGLLPDEYSCCNDVGAPFSTLSGYATPPPCSLTPYFPDQAADSLAGP
jgi:hypothetical protein